VPGCVTHPRPPAVLVLVLALAAALGVSGPSAFAAPNPTPSGEPDEGGTPSLREVLEAAAKGHIEAKVKLDNSLRRQLGLKLELQRVQAHLARLTDEVGVVAAESYRMGRLTPMTMLLNSASPDLFLQRAAGLDLIAQRDGRAVAALTETRNRLAQTKKALDAEVVEQRKQLAVLATRKQQAERALATVGGQPTGGYVSPRSPLAEPAPRNEDGSWPRESCTVDDPTTSGCITPRTLHAYEQARAAGFTRYVSCFREGGSGEHPKGRACDFAAARTGFKNETATGGDREYGNNLAAYFVRNASRLGVLYVIWYRQIWMPGTGWRSYSGGGSPSADHTNHVHLSMY
jgi:peptidoglycan DL-endopeptidase CwlO